ncbi:MAG TPA: hypothetical protein DEP42_02830, partial [Ruminococcaceae bacterium]|nr:hypothetical protein [Oscillospiraceae bacterium]
MKKKIVFPKGIAILFECGILDSVVSLANNNKKFYYYSEFGKRKKIHDIKPDEVYDYKILSTCLVFCETVDD